MMTQESPSKVLFGFVAIVAILGIECLINKKVNKRWQQALFPIVGIAVTALSVLVLVFLQGDLGVSFSEDSRWYNVDVVAVNFLSIIVFVILKIFLMAVSGKELAGFRKFIVESFYDFDSDRSCWELKDNWANYRGVVLGCTIGTGVLSALFLGMTWGFGSVRDLHVAVYPSIVLVGLLEFYWFLNGNLKSPDADSIGGDEINYTRIGQYFRVREILEKVFPDQVLSAHSGCDFMQSGSATTLLNNLAHSEDRIDRIVADHFRVRKKGTPLDEDMIHATVHLMHRKSVVIFNPFYLDTGDYTSLPIINTLLTAKKVLVITGRSSTQEDVKSWIEEIIQEYCRVHSLWKVGFLCEKVSDLDVGIIPFRSLYDLKAMAANREFLTQTDFVLLLEPSLVVNTGQLALSIISEEIASDGIAPVYCVCDRRTNGLVDTLSHLLHTEIVEVSATPVPRCMYTGITWNADGDYGRQRLFNKQTQYLGNGVEIAAIAVKNQIPKVTWYSETKTPVRDVKWIAGQFYPTICKCMNISSQQQSLYEKIEFVSNLWCTPAEAEQFIIVDDEFCNMFNTLNMYLSRASRQVFINVLSENYLLRDYMRCNQRMFLSDPNAIPSLVPDYSKTERNTILKLVIIMAFRHVTEDEVRSELKLVGIETEDIFAELTKLLHRYTNADDRALTVKNLMREEELETTETYNTFSITDTAFEEFFSDTLKNAYYIVEDEKGNTECIDAKLFGHVVQSILPGQVLTYDGKYYWVKYLSPTSGVILHRASDLYSERKYYRQVRTYHFESFAEDSIIQSRRITDMEVSFVRGTFSVDTTAYLEMNDRHDLRSAKLVDFSEDPTIPKWRRSYKNKSLIRLKMPEMTESMRFTTCILLSEIFKSVFPDAWPYLAVMTKRTEPTEGSLNYMVYNLDGDVEDDVIYIVEDSTLDLGLLEAFDKKLPYFMELMADFLDWHREKLREPESKDPQMGTVSLPKQERREIERMEERQKQRRSLIKRLAVLIGIGKEREDPDPVIEPGPAEVQVENPTPPEQKQEPYTLEPEPTMTTELPQEVPEEEPEKVQPGNEEGKQEEGPADYRLQQDESEEEPVPAENPEPSMPDEDEESKTQKPEKNLMKELFDDEESEDANIVHIDDTDIFSDIGTDMDLDWLNEKFEEAGIITPKLTRYQQECFLKFGFDEFDSRIETKSLFEYLNARGWSNNALTKARKRLPYDMDLMLDTQNHCDFCGMPLSGVSYERLADGRVRCNDCAASAINTVEEFRELFNRVSQMMEGVFGIEFKMRIMVNMVDADTIAKTTGRVFTPTQDYAVRTLGVARCHDGKYSILIESGAPRLAAIITIVHELTHIWQYVNWDRAKILDLYGDANEDLVYEGMAMWASVQFLYQIGEISHAMVQELENEAREDIYGQGFLYYKQKYPFMMDTGTVKISPFKTFPPL